MNQAFGPLLRRLREDSGFGLREFADWIGEKAGNLSAIETGNRAAWKSPDKLLTVASQLGLEKGTVEWAEFFNAAQRSGEFPADVQPLAHRKLIPSLLRTVDRAQLTEEELRVLIRHIETQHELSTRDI